MDQDKIEKNIELISNITLMKRGKWHQSVIMHEIYADGQMTQYQEKLGYPFEVSLQITYKDDFFDSLDEWNKNRDIVRKKYSEDKNYFSHYFDDCLTLGEELIKKSKIYRQIEAGKLNSEDLGLEYRQLVEDCKGYIPFLYSLHIFDEFLSEKFDQLLKEYIRDNNLSQNDFFEYQLALTLPYRKIFLLEEKQQLMRLALNFKEKKISENQLIDKLSQHKDKFGWMNTVNLENLPFTADYYKERISEMIETDIESELEMMTKEEEHLRQRQHELMNQINDNDELFFISQMVQKFGFLRSFRMDAVVIAFENGWGIFEEIAKRLKLHNILDLTFLDSEEVVSALNGLLDYKSLIKMRKVSLLSLAVDRERYELIGDDVEKVLPYINFPKDEVSGSVRGNVAFPGKVTGKCIILHSVHDMDKIKKGDILVIAMTDTNYIPAMERAAAFVTDQGGILCHAAIISREMKKPCIIGTKNATKVLKDGDLIEVDADKGIIKIIERV